MMSQSLPPDFRILFESAPGLYLVLYPDLTIATASDAYLRTTNTRRAQMTGISLFEAFPGHLPAAPRDKMRTSLELVLANRVPDVMAVQPYYPQQSGDECDDAEPRYFKPVNMPVLGPGRELVYILHRLDDVSELERAQQQLITQGERLKNMAAELEASNTELNAFTYSVSHDLRAPLRAINGFTRVLQKEIGDSLPPEAQHYLNRVHQRSSEMQRMIDDLLTLSRISRQPLTRQPLDPAVIMHNARRSLYSEQEGRQVEILIPDLPTCSADPLLLKQAFTNLLANALKFTRNVEVTRIEIGSQMDGDLCVYYIRDNGVGFDMEYADKLFGVFQKLHRNDEFEGSGVGLAIVHRIISRHGGRVWGESEAGKGATFYFTLPGATTEG